MQTVAFSGGPREGLGKKATKKVREQGLIPCVMYGGNEVRHFTTVVNDVKTLIYSPNFKTADITVGDTAYKCIVKEVQYHPLTDEILHIDFLQLVDGTPVKVELPVRFYGDSPGMKVGGKLLQNLRRIKIKTTPEHLVDELKVDISSLELGQAVRVKDVDVTDNMEVMVSPATPVAVVEVPRALKSASAAAAKEGETSADVPVIGEEE